MNQVLIVDDSAMARALVKRSLEVCGYENIEFTEANNGLNALKQLRSKLIDIVFSDLNMPEMDGEALFEKGLKAPQN